MGKIGRPIQRVHVPAKFRVAFVPGSLFRGDGVLWKIFCKARDNRFLGALIRLRDQVDVALIADLDGPVELFAQDFASFLGNFNGGIEVIFAHEEMARRSASSACATRNALSTLPSAWKKKLRPRTGNPITGYFFQIAAIFEGISIPSELN